MGPWVIEVVCRAVDEGDGLKVSPRFKRALEAAGEEARRRGHSFLGSKHVLLCILSEPD